MAFDSIAHEMATWNNAPLLKRLDILQLVEELNGNLARQAREEFHNRGTNVPRSKYSTLTYCGLRFQYLSER